jgi:hypothetical protein
MLFATVIFNHITGMAEKPLLWPLERLLKQRSENPLLSWYQAGEKKTGQATEVRQSHMGNGFSPLSHTCE